MAAHKEFVIVVFLVAIAMTGLANGQSFCGMTGEGLKACEPSVSGQNPIPPTPPCCSALSNANLQCLCRYKSSGLLSFYKIDPDEAMALPAKCKIVDSSFHC